MEKSQIKRIWKKTWHFLWHSDSWTSWVVNIILAFVIIKFLVYPGLGLAFSTSYPIVAVVSSSMEHDGSFDDWWNSQAYCGSDICTQAEHYAAYTIDQAMFKDFSFKNGFNKGDLMILYGTTPENLAVGDVIVFRADRPDPIIHRIISKKDSDNGYVFLTKGDHNPTSLPIESFITEDRYIGKSVLRIPLLGYIKIGFVELIYLFR